MKIAAKLALFSAPFLSAALFPPSVDAQAPLTTGTGPSIQAHAGFEYLQQPIPTSSRIPMYGLDSGATIGVSRHFGVRLDLGYARASDVLSSGHHSDILSYLGGPVYYPFITRHSSSPDTPTNSPGRAAVALRSERLKTRPCGWVETIYTRLTLTRAPHCTGKAISGQLLALSTFWDAIRGAATDASQGGSFTVSQSFWQSACLGPYHHTFKLRKKFVQVPLTRWARGTTVSCWPQAWQSL